jgi:nucleoside phosphorylase
VLSILIVDDNSDKLGKILEVIDSLPESESFIIETALDLRNAEKHMSSKSFDLMILDLQLPKRLGQKPESDAGVHFLGSLKSRSDLKRPFHIIGITAHEGLLQAFGDAFEDELWTLIRFEEQYNNWQEKLRNKIEYLIVSKKEIINPTNISYQYNLAIVTALKSELDSVLDLPGNWEKVNLSNDKTTVYYKGYFVGDNKKISVIAAYCPQMGMTASSVLTMKLIQEYRPKYLCMTGIAAGIRGRANFGDILLVDHSWDYGSGKMVYDKENNKTKFMPDPKPILLEPEIKTQFELFDKAILYKIFSDWKSNKPSLPPEIIIGPVASGAAVLENSLLVDEQIKQQNRKLVGVEMEVYGVYHAAKYCSEPRPTVFALKSVCDFADNEKSDDYQGYASYTSAQVLYHFVVNSL